MNRTVFFIFFICIEIFLALNINLPVYSSDNSVLVSMVKFEGNKTIERETLLNLIEVKAGEKLDKEALKTDLQKILEKYKELGMPFVTVTPVTTRTGLNRAQLVIKIDEGKSLKIGEIRFDGNNIFSKSALLDELRLPRGRQFDYATFKQGIDRILRLYSEHGYPRVELNPVDFHIDKNGTIDLTIQIDERELVEVSEVKVTGLNKTRPNVILRELPIKPGSQFDQRDVDESYRILKNIGYFYDVKPELLEPGKSSSEIVFNARVTEARTGQINGVIGYDPSDESDGKKKLTGMIKVAETNLLGTGRKLNLLWKSGMVEVYRFGYEEPWLFGRPISAGIEFAAVNQTDQLTELLSKERSASFSIGTRWHRKLEGKMTATYKMIDFPAEGETPNLRQDDLMRSGSKYGIKFSLQRDSRDYILNPTQGRLDSVAIEISRGDFRLKKIWLDLNQYFATWEKQVLAVGLHGAVCYGNEIPPTELFYLGGSATLRGYGENWFRGTKRFYSNIEYRFLVGRTSQLFLFTDFGSVTSIEKADQFGHLQMGYGFGVRLESRSGILRIDYGLAKGDSPLEGKIHVNLGLVR